MPTIYFDLNRIPLLDALPAVRFASSSPIAGFCNQVSDKFADIMIAKLNPKAKVPFTKKSFAIRKQFNPEDADLAPVNVNDIEIEIRGKMSEVWEGLTTEIGDALDEALLEVME